jgi:hypothetical protein
VIFMGYDFHRKKGNIPDSTYKKIYPNGGGEE